VAAEIRAAASSDLNRLVEIYNHYVLETHITFDTEPFAVAERIQWFNQFATSGRYRLLVAETEAGIVGYASSTYFKPRAAYNTSVETTIYMDPEHLGQGIGGLLYATLVDELLAEESVHRAYAGIALPNDGSLALHRRLGFRHVGSYHEVGFKFDKFWDVDWFEKDVSGQ
jgi:phosphinothricin acetyltransferase